MKIYDKHCLFLPLFYPREVKFYTDIVHASAPGFAHSGRVVCHIRTPCWLGRLPEPLPQHRSQVPAAGVTSAGATHLMPALLMGMARHHITL